MILFKTIKWRNFLSTGQQFTELDFTKNSTNLIIGSNGAGKSTVLDALCFSLFGKPFRTISKSQLVNSINNKDCIVEVNLIRVKHVFQSNSLTSWFGCFFKKFSKIKLNAI